MPTAVVAPAKNALDVNDAALARLLTSREYCPATASEVVVAEAMFLSATEAANPANWLLVFNVVNDDFNASRALVKVP